MHRFLSRWTLWLIPWLAFGAGPGVLLQAAPPPPATRLSALVVAAAREPIMLAAPMPADTAVLDEVAEIERIQKLPPMPIPVQDTPLASAIVVICNAAEMSMIAPSAEEFPENVTLTTRVNPWEVLELLAERYRFTMKFRRGVWLFDREQEGTLYSKVYVLKNTNLDTFKASQNSFTQLGSTQSLTAGAAGGNAGGGGVAGGLVFTPQSQTIIDQLRAIVGMPPSVLVTSGQLPAEDPSKRPIQGPAAERSGDREQPQVLYIPSVRALHVTTTRRRHERVENYIKTIDQPVKQIYIEVRFYQTSYDPKLVLGIDPSGWQPNVSLSDMVSQINLNKLRATRLATNGTLKVNDMNFQMNALATDSTSRLIQSPSVTVADNSEAYFSVGDEEPFVSANSMSAGAIDAGFGTSQAQIAIRRIGTSVNVLPTYFPGDEQNPANIRLVLRIEVGALKGFRHINTVDVPVVNSQRYEYTANVKENEAFAFGGLSGISESEDIKKVPIAGDVPLVGYIFKSKSKTASQSNLIAYITARVRPVGEKSVMPSMAPTTPAPTALTDPPMVEKKPLARLQP